MASEQQLWSWRLIRWRWLAAPAVWMAGGAWWLAGETGAAAALLALGALIALANAALLPAGKRMRDGPGLSPAGVRALHLAQALV